MTNLLSAVRKFSVLIFIILVCAPLIKAEGAFYDPSYEVYTVQTPHFVIHYPKQVAPAAQDLVNIVEKVYAAHTIEMNWTPRGKTHVVLIDQSDRPNGLATILPANYMLLYVTPPEGDSPLDNYSNYLTLLFTHEFTHILHMDQHFRLADPPRWLLGKIIAPNGMTPSWMREGIAVYEESKQTGLGRANYSYSDALLRNAILENKFPKIDEIAGFSRKFPQSDMSYMFGGKFFQWLSDKYGEDRLQKYMEEYASGLWLFSLNNKARRVYNKSFYQLWDEWQADLKIKYTDVKNELVAKGLTPVAEMNKSSNAQSYPVSFGGGGYAYSEMDFDDSPKIKIVKKPGDKAVEINRATFGQISVSKDATKVAYAQVGNVEAFHQYSDVYIYDLAAKKTVRVYDSKLGATHSLRAMDPDFSSQDGGTRWLVMVRTDLGTDNLYVYDTKAKIGHFITNTTKYTQFSNPRYSPDGQTIVVSRRDNLGNRDIVLYSREGVEIKKLTDDVAIDGQPTWSPDGKYVFFQSDKSGVSNIYRYTLATGENSRLTNVIGGLYQPSVSSDGQKLFAQSFSAKGPRAVAVDMTSLGAFETTRPVVAVDESKDKKKKGKKDEAKVNYDSIIPNFVSAKYGLPYEEVLKDKNGVPIVAGNLLPGSKKYNAFPKVLVPQYIVPTFATMDSSLLIGFSTGNFDPMYRHNWALYADYRSDANFLEGGASYTYLRYKPTLTVGVARYSLDWGDIYGIGANFYESRLQGYIGTSYSYKKHNFGLTYFYEARDNISAIPIGAATLSTLDTNAGLRFNYIFSNAKYFPNSISQEDGYFFKLAVDFTNEMLGSAEPNEQVVVIGDARYYLEMPWNDHHVLAFRLLGGWVWGDREAIGGTLRFGGPFGEGNMAGYSSKLIPFRGLSGVTFSGDRALVSSIEYRVPLWKVDRGPGTWPIFLRTVHLNIFSDYGDIWARNAKDNINFFKDFFLSAGAELKGDLVLGYGLPVTARLGYGVVLLNRDRLAGLQDSLFGTALTNGTVYLQFGTSF